MSVSRRKRLRVGLFVEGTDLDGGPGTDWLKRLWTRLAEHCDREIDLEVVGMKNKLTILQLVPADLDPGVGAVQLMRTGVVQAGPLGEPVGLKIGRLHAKNPFDRVILAFDLWPGNQFLSAAEVARPCQMRSEVAFVLRRLRDCAQLPAIFRNAAIQLLTRYESDEPLHPRTDAPTALEVLFMTPHFEDLFLADEVTIRRALDVSKKPPKDWPSFKGARRQPKQLAKSTLDRAFRSVRRGEQVYSSAVSRWGCLFVEKAGPDARLWRHALPARLCRLLTAA